MRKYTVQALTLELERLMQRTYPVVLVEGEVSQLQTPASGHAYLTLREGDACLPCVVWRADWRRSPFQPKPGDRVLCRGRLGLYPSQGRYQLYVNVLRPAGEGGLQREIEERKARLAADGLLDPRRKRPLPPWPRVVGLATSPTGAALQDFLKVSRERFPAAHILLAGCTVQGPEAPASVIRALEMLYHDGRADVIVVTRGGGSKADLMPFNDEQLARFIADAPVPVVSAVGHEIDTTIADLVADAVAPTPTAAAVQVLPDGPALAQRVDETVFSLEAAVRREIGRQRHRVDSLRSRLRHPGDRLRQVAQRREELDKRLNEAMARRLREARGRLQGMDERVAPAMGRILDDRRRRLEGAERALQALSPFAVLERGYAIVSGPDGVVTTPEEVAAGDALDVRVRGGRFGVTVR